MTGNSRDVVQLQGAEAIELASALTAHAAESHGLRCLFIKGIAAVTSGVRPQRSSADTDVLVHPDDMSRLLEILQSGGWSLRPSVENMGIPEHSNTLYHSSWPCDIDLHFCFPGFDSEPDISFDYLFNSSVDYNFAGVCGRIPNRGALAVIQIVHSLRNLHFDDHYAVNANADYDFLKHSDNRIIWSELVPVLDATASWAAMRPFLLDVYPEDCEGRQFPPPSQDWLARTSSSYLGVHRIARLVQAPWREKPVILFRSVFPSRHDFAAVDLEFLNASWSVLMYRRAIRLIYFLCKAPQIFREVSRYMKING